VLVEIPALLNACEVDTCLAALPHNPLRPWSNA
jgi:hypothetical protein